MNIDLNSCMPGQFLRTVHGALLVYVGRRSVGAPYNHEIRFADGRGGGTRLDDGHVFERNRQECDEDVAEILPAGWGKVHVTKDGVEVKVGQVWRDLDKRMNGRRVQVREIGAMTFEGKVRVQNFTDHSGATGTKRWLAVSRMHRHSSGFALVIQADGTPVTAPQ